MEKNMAVVEPWRVTDPVESGLVFNFLCRSWGASALEVSKAHYGDFAAPTSAVTGNPFAFASSETSQLIMEQSEEVISGRLSHSTSSGPLNGSLTDSPPLSPSQIIDHIKYWRLNNQSNRQYRGRLNKGKTVGRWLIGLKDRKEKNKEETRAHNAQLHAAVSVAGVAAAVAAIAAASSAKEIDMAVASASALVAAQCVEAAESMGADRHHLASVVSSAVNVRSAADIMTLIAAAATALRGAATLKARVLNGLVIGAASGSNASSGIFTGDIVPEDNFLCIIKELLARGTELLKRTRKGHLHWKIVSVYINPLNQVTLKMKSRHAAGTITKKNKNLVLEVVKDMPAWPGRYLLEGGEKRRYFGLKTVDRGLVEFECKTQREYEVWTEGVSKLLSLAAEKTNNRHRI